MRTAHIRRLYLLVPILLLLAFSAQSLEQLYRWIDPKGVTHFGDRAPPQSQEVTTISLVTESRPVLVKSVHDGDTITLIDGRKVRLIGINAPEVARKNDPAQQGGDAAAKWLQHRLRGKKVVLVHDAEQQDRYKRQLAYVELEDGTDINRELLANGLAHVVVKPPNIGRLQLYLQTEAKARQQQLGIWQNSQYQLTNADVALRYRNTFRRLQGVVTRVEPKKTAWILSLGNNTKIIIANDYVDSFTAEGKHPRKLLQQQLIVRGWVHQSQGEPVVRLVHPAEIESVSAP